MSACLLSPFAVHAGGEFPRRRAVTRGVARAFFLSAQGNFKMEVSGQKSSLLLTLIYAPAILELERVLVGYGDALRRCTGQNARWERGDFVERLCY